MYKLIPGLLAISLAAPAAAQSEPVDPRDRELVDALPDPREMEAMGEVLGRTVDAVMDVKVGPIVEAIDPERRMDPRERERTLGDMAAEDDPYYRERMQDEIAAASVGMAVLAERLAVLAPVLRETMEDVERRLDDAMRGVPND